MLVSRARCRSGATPSAAIAWVVALALLPYVAIPLYLMFGSRKLLDAGRTLAGPPPIAPAVADDDEAASVWARRLGRSMGLAPAAPYEALRLHADGTEAQRHAVLDVISRRDPRTLDVCTFILARDKPGRRDRGGAAREEPGQGVSRSLLIDGIGAWFVRPPRRQGSAPRRGRRGHLRAALPLDPARPRQPAQPSQDDRRRRSRGSGAAGATSPPVFRRRSRPRQPSSGTTSASTCADGLGVRARRQFEELELCDPGPVPASVHLVPPRARYRDRSRPTRRSRSSCRAAPSRSTTRCRRCLLSGCFMAQQPLLDGDAVLHPRRDAFSWRCHWPRAAAWRST